MQDATFIVLGSLDPSQSAKDESGNVITVYPISTQRSFGTVPPISLNVTQAEVTAANLTVGHTYIFFWGADPASKTACIVGGVRGVMAYNFTTDTVTRLDDASGSQIPQTQTLAQFATSVNSAQITFSKEPIRNQPPVCSPSATGLPTS